VQILVNNALHRNNIQIFDNVKGLIQNQLSMRVGRVDSESLMDLDAFRPFICMLFVKMCSYHNIAWHFDYRKNDVSEQSFIHAFIGIRAVRWSNCGIYTITHIVS